MNECGSRLRLATKVIVMHTQEEVIIHSSISPLFHEIVHTTGIPIRPSFFTPFLSILPVILFHSDPVLSGNPGLLFQWVVVVDLCISPTHICIFSFFSFFSLSLFSFFLPKGERGRRWEGGGGGEGLRRVRRLFRYFRRGFLVGMN